MTRTRRQRHQTDDTTSYSITSPHERGLSLTEIEWTQITETLDGLVRLEFPSPFTDLQSRCPKEAWCVVKLARIRASSDAVNLRSQISSTLGALTRLLVCAERLRPWSDLYESFWRRILKSEMLRGVDEDEATICNFIRYVRANGSHVALEWRCRGLETRQIMVPLTKWLVTEVRFCEAYVPVQISLRFENCQLTLKSLKEIHKLLVIPSVATSKQLLIDTSTLKELSFSSNILPMRLLQGITTMLQDPSTRRIDGLKLNSTIPDPEHQVLAYGTCFSQVVAAAVTQKSTLAHITDHGVSLSLEDCTIKYGSHIDALVQAFAHASRPLRGLSLACWYLPDAQVLTRFGRLLLTPLLTATEAFDLNVSCLRTSGNPFEGVFDLVTAHVEYVREALAAGQSISIRPKENAEFFADDYHLEVRLSGNRYYNVRSILDCGCCRTIASVNGREMIGNVEPLTIAHVRVGTSRGPSGLIMHRCTRQGHEDHACVSIPEVAVNGGNLQRLSMRHQPWNSSLFNAWSPTLEELNVEGCCKDQGRLCHDIHDAGLNITSLNVANCSLDASALECLLECRALRRLEFARNKLIPQRMGKFYCIDREIQLRELEPLLNKLQSDTMLEYVDLSKNGIDPDDPSQATTVLQINSLLQMERISAEATREFCIALRRIEEVSLKHQRVPSEVITSILAFANVAASRQVLW